MHVIHLIWTFTEKCKLLSTVISRHLQHYTHIRKDDTADNTLCMKRGYNVYFNWLFQLIYSIPVPSPIAQYAQTQSGLRARLATEWDIYFLTPNCKSIYREGIAHSIAVDFCKSLISINMAQHSIDNTQIKCYMQNVHNADYIVSRCPPVDSVTRDCQLSAPAQLPKTNHFSVTGAIKQQDCNCGTVSRLHSATKAIYY